MIDTPWALLREDSLEVKRLKNELADLNKRFVDKCVKKARLQMQVDEKWALRRELEAELGITDEAKLELKFERADHRATKQSLKYVTQERNQLRRALALIAEDCASWLGVESDVGGCDFVRRIREYAYKKSQAPLLAADTLPSDL